MPLLEIVKIELLFIFALFLPLILQLLVLFVVSRSLWGFTQRYFGRGLWAILALIGIPIHELSHAAAFIITGAGVQKLVLFAPKGLDEHDGATGIVIPKRKPTTFSLLVSSIAPLFGCTLIAWIVLQILLPNLTTNQTLLTLSFDSFHGSNFLQTILMVLGSYISSLVSTLISVNWGNWQTYLAIYLAASLGMGAAPSGTDLKYFFPAFGIILLILLPIFGILVLFGNPDAALTSLQNGVGSIILSIGTAVTYAALFALLALLLLFIFSIFTRGIRRRA